MTTSLPASSRALDKVQRAVSPFTGKVSEWLNPGLPVRGEDEALFREFQQSAAAIEETPLSTGSHLTLYLVTALVVIAMCWATFSSLDRIVVAPGRIVSRTPTLVLQPSSSARLLSIAVKPGDHVKKGQVLANFDPVFAQADLAVLKQRVQALSVTVERLQAELAGQSFTADPGADADRLNQAQIFDQDRAQFAAEMAQRDRQVAGVESQLGADQSNLAGLNRQRDMAQKVVDIHKYLQSQQAGAPLDVMNAESARIDVESKLKTTEGEARRFQAQRAEMQAERQSFIDRWRNDRSEQLMRTRQDLMEARQNLQKAQKISDLTQLVAPADGVVLQVADRSAGSVLREGETLMTLVSDTAPLYIEASVSSRDMSELRTGEKVRLKLDAYPFQRYGTLAGTLMVISADTIASDEAQTPTAPMAQVYRLRVRLDDSTRNLAKRGIYLRPGLLAASEIETGRRTVASYILNPILKTADESFREP